jgi:Ca2+-binding EF-hand superfamily protein
MKILGVLLAVFALCSVAQEPEGGQRRGRGGPGGGGGTMRMSPSMRILDADQDGVISAAEIRAAASQLAKLDANGDGKITEDEMRPQGGGFEGRRGPEGRGGEGQGPSADDTVNMLMQFDKDQDGKLTKSEVPERMQGVFARYDANQDGVLTRDELSQGAAKQASRQGGPDGGRPGGSMMRFDPVFAALDADQDGEISRSEWSAAAKVLATLDKNGDGQLTADEVRPAFPGGRRGPGREDH